MATPHLLGNLNMMLTKFDNWCEKIKSQLSGGVVGRGVLLVGRGLDGQADGWDIREEGDVGGFGGTRALEMLAELLKSSL